LFFIVIIIRIIIINIFIMNSINDVIVNIFIISVT